MSKLEGQQPVDSNDLKHLQESLENAMKTSQVLFQNVNPFIPTTFEPR